MIFILICSLLIFDNLYQEIGLIYYTIGLILIFYLSKYFGQIIQVPIVLKLLIPSFFLFYAFYLNISHFGINLYLIVHPILYAYLAMLSGLLIKEEEKSVYLRNNIIIVTLAFLIPISHKYHQSFTNPNLSKQYDFGITVPQAEIEEIEDDSLEISLSDILLYNRNKDTVKLESAGKYTLLETWHEKCPPCLKAMHDLKPFYASAQFNQKYIYVRPIKKDDIDFEKLYASDIVSKKLDSHLVDYDEILYNSGIKGTPCFLLFDPSGKLVFKHLGYSSTYAEELKKNILRIINR